MNDEKPPRRSQDARVLLANMQTAHANLKNRFVGRPLVVSVLASVLAVACGGCVRKTDCVQESREIYTESLAEARSNLHQASLDMEKAGNTLGSCNDIESKSPSNVSLKFLEGAYYIRAGIMARQSGDLSGGPLALVRRGYAVLRSLPTSGLPFWVTGEKYIVMRDARSALAGHWITYGF